MIDHLGFESHFFKCECHTDVIEVSQCTDLEDLSICLAIWSRGQKSNEVSWNWKEQLRVIWYIIKNGRPYHDEIILHPIEAKELGNRLISMANKAIDVMPGPPV